MVLASIVAAKNLRLPYHLIHHRPPPVVLAGPPVRVEKPPTPRRRSPEPPRARCHHRALPVSAPPSPHTTVRPSPMAGETPSLVAGEAGGDHPVCRPPLLCSPPHGKPAANPHDHHLLPPPYRSPELPASPSPPCLFAGTPWPLLPLPMPRSVLRAASACSLSCRSPMAGTVCHRRASSPEHPRPPMPSWKKPTAPPPPLPILRPARFEPCRINSHRAAQAPSWLPPWPFLRHPPLASSLSERAIAQSAGCFIIIPDRMYRSSVPDQHTSPPL